MDQFRKLALVWMYSFFGPVLVSAFSAAGGFLVGCIVVKLTDASQPFINLGGFIIGSLIFIVAFIVSAAAFGYRAGLKSAASVENNKMIIAIGFGITGWLTLAYVIGVIVESGKAHSLSNSREGFLGGMVLTALYLPLALLGWWKNQKNEARASHL